MLLFLTSSASTVAHDLSRHLSKPPQHLSLVFIPTAAEPEGGSKSWLSADKQSLVDAGFSVTEYTISGKTRKRFQADLAQFDVFFISGGNSFYLLEKMRESGFDHFITQQLHQGKVYIGSSAGSIVMGPNIEVVKKLDNHLQAPNLKSYDGLNLVNFVLLPHWGHPKFRELYLGERLNLAYEQPYPYIVLRDTQYVKVVDAGLEIISV